ncbi:hypothetical protein Tco_0205267 [Tanacetum coccineum]
MEKHNGMYMMNRPHGRMILASVEKGPLVWPSITEDGVTRLKEYVELTPAEAIQADYGFDKFTYKKRRVVTVKDLHTTNVDQLHAYLQQHERHANEVCLMHERNSDPLALVASHQLTQPAYQSHLYSHPKSQSQLHVSPYQIFQKGDDPIDAINHMMSFLTAVVTSDIYYQQSAKDSSNPRQTKLPSMMESNVATCSGESNYFAAGTKRKIHTWLLLDLSQASGQALTEEEIAFLADPGLPDIQTSQTVITHNAAY